jgi:hypothetical protein
MKKGPFANPRLSNNYVEKVAWNRLCVEKRLERGLDWGHEMERIHQKLFGKTIKLQKLQKDLQTQKVTLKVERQ